MTLKNAFICATMLLATQFTFSGIASAHEYKGGNLHIDHPWSKEVPPTSQVAAAFFTIDNHGKEADTLLSASSPIAGKTELHAHVNENGMMKMREVQEITIPAEGQQNLKPGGLHIMFFDLKKTPALGESFPLTLNFKHAGTVEVEVKVEKATYQSDAMKMDHSDH